MNILFIGDIVGRAGRRSVRIFLDKIKKEYKVDFVISMVKILPVVLE